MPHPTARPPLRLHILSDLHLSLQGLEPPDVQADLTILAGDIARPRAAMEWAGRIPRPVLYVPGNHEFYGASLQQTARTLRALSSPNEVEEGEESAIGKIVEAYHAWREGRSDYADVPGFCKAVKNEDIEAQGFVLTPGRYVGAAAAEEDDTPFAERFSERRGRLEAQILEGERLNAIIRSGMHRVVSDAS